MLEKYLGGRVAGSSGLNTKFFQQVFETCPGLGWSLIKVILRCFLTKSKDQDDKDNDEKESKGQEGSRSNHQRL